MRILYVFPHPDDESFGPGPGIAAQRLAGHEVHLLTLTRGGATKVRHELGYSVAEMGEVRLGEMRQVAKVLDLTSMVVLDLPDSGLKEMDPRAVEQPIREAVHKLRPDVLVTYAVHGISGFHDHLVTHAAVKRVFVEESPLVRRLALFTVTQEAIARAPGGFRLTASTAEEIDCILRPTAEEQDRGQRALDCYETYAQTVERSGVRRMLDHVAFEWWQEDSDQPAEDLFAGLE